MIKFIESKNKGGGRLYINVNHILSVDETGENRCLIITDLSPTGDSVLPFYYTVDVSYDEVIALIKGGAEVKYGEWHLLDDCANEGVYCSVCHKKVYRTDYANQKLKSKFCPNCGADMRGEK